MDNRNPDRKPDISTESMNIWKADDMEKKEGDIEVTFGDMVYRLMDFERFENNGKLMVAVKLKGRTMLYYIPKDIGEKDREGIFGMFDIFKKLGNIEFVDIEDYIRNLQQDKGVWKMIDELIDKDKDKGKDKGNGKENERK